MKLVAALSGKDKISWFRDYLITQARKQERVSLHLQTEVTEELVKKVNRDVLIITTGAYTSNRDHVLSRSHRAGVEIITEHLVREVTDTKVIAIDKNRRERSIEADKVVVAAGAASARELDTNLKGEVPQIYVVGDAAEPRDIAAATYDGALIALLPKSWRKWKEGYVLAFLRNEKEELSWKETK